MMEILLNLTSSFSVMERRLSKLISDVSDIKKKQDNLQYSLYCLQPRKSDGEHRRGFLPSPERPSWLRQRKSSSSSSTSSTPVKRKPSAAWYVTDSFAEQFSPPLHSRSLAQPSFELAYPSHSLTQPSDHLLTPLQPRKILGKSAKPTEKGVVRQFQLSAVQRKQHEETIAVEHKPMDKESRVSAGPCQQHHLQIDSQQADMPNKPTDDPENRENNDPERTSKSAPVDSSGVLSIPLASDVVMKIRYVSSSRRNFSANLNRKIFTVAERKVSNVNGVLSKSQLNPDKVAYIRKVTFRIYPLSSKEIEASEWSNCIAAIDEVNRRLNNTKKNKKVDKKGKN